MGNFLFAMDEKTEYLYTDVMYKDVNMFLVIVTDLLQLALVSCIERESQEWITRAKWNYNAAMLLYPK